MFSRKEKKQLVNSFDLLHQTVIKPEPNPFDQMLELSEILLEGRGVLALFSDIEDEITKNGEEFKRRGIFRVMIKYIAPVFLFIILVFYTLAQFGFISY